MSIEACGFLRPSLKAKIQDGGIIFLDDLIRFFEHTGEPADKGHARHPTAANNSSSSNNEGENRNGDTLNSSTANAAVGTTPSNRASAAGPQQQQHQQQQSPVSKVFTLRCDDGLDASLRQQFPRLTADEVHDLIASTTSFLVGREAQHHQSQTQRSGASGRRSVEVSRALGSCGGGGSTTAVTATATSTAVFTGASPCFTMRTLGEIERESRRPSRERPWRLRGPTHATTFCRGLDALLGAPDDADNTAVIDEGGVAAARARPSTSRGCDIAAREAVRVREGGKGAEVGKVTEVSGPPGVGKTQMLLQLAVSCAMPVELGGLGGDCLFIDTEGSFAPERFTEVALAAVALVRDLVRRCKQRAAVPTTTTTTPPPAALVVTAPTPLERLAENFSLPSILQRVHYVRTADTAAFMATLYSLPTWVVQMEEGRVAAAAPGDGGRVNTSNNLTAAPHAFALKMILIDSIAGPFRTVDSGANGNGIGNGGGGGATSNSTTTSTDLSSHRQRSRLLFTCGERLQSCASALNVAVVVSNQVTSRTARRDRGSGRSSGNKTSGGSGGGGGVSKRHRPEGGRSTPGGGQTEEESTSEDDDDDDGDDNKGSLNTAKGGGGGSNGNGNNKGRSADEDGNYYTYLVPALGDTWAVHAATRLILSYHHYALPYFLSSSSVGKTNGCPYSSPSLRFPGVDGARGAMLERAMCPEDLAVTRRLHGGGGGGAASATTTSQHRVARLIKHDCNLRGECCFAISRKGIRDASRL